MVHPLVEQLRFTRSEWLRAFDGITAEEAVRRFEPINSLSWMVGHLAYQEQMYWLYRAQDINLIESVWLCGFNQPATTPPLDEMWEAWHSITKVADEYLDSLTTEKLLEFMLIKDKPHNENIGTMLHRMTYHYWFHLGESQAVRQLLGHKRLPGFVGDISNALYRAERD